MNKRYTGKIYEQAAGGYLEQQGYEMLKYNYRCPLGEIDFIAKDREYLVFGEVKYRRAGSQGNPLEAVGLQKQRRIARCAQYYLNERRLRDVLCRFDVVGIQGSKVYLVKNAFEAG